MLKDSFCKLKMHFGEGAEGIFPVGTGEIPHKSLGFRACAAWEGGIEASF